MKKLLFGAFVVSLAAATPARAQGDRPVHLNIGGGATMPISDVSDRFGTGGGFNLGVIFEPTPTFGIQIEYAYNTLSGESKTIPVSFPEPQAVVNGTALIESHHKMHYIDFNGILQTSGESIVKPYGIGGFGMYYRSVSLTTPDVGFTTWCDPYWYVCYPVAVPVDRIIGDRGSWDPGINFGAGIGFKLGESALMYVEMRWHYMWGPEFTGADGIAQKANGQYLPITFGFRFQSLVPEVVLVSGTLFPPGVRVAPVVLDAEDGCVIPGRLDQHKPAELGNALPEFLRAAVEWLPTGVLIVNTDSAIVVANREIERMFGYTSTELTGELVDVLVPDASRAAHAGFRQDYLQHPQPRIMAAGRELFGRRKDGSEVPVEVRLTPVAVGETRFVLASVIDVSDRNRSQRDVRAARDERRQFEALVGDLGAEFVNLRPDDIDRTIEEALGRVVRTLDLDRSALFQLVDESGDFVHTHQWTRPGWPSPPPRVPATEQLPWHLTQIRAGHLVSFETLDEVPNEIDRASLARLGTRSSITVPLAIEGRTWGAVSFGVVRDSRQWTPEVINRLRVVALILANVLARRQGDETLRRVVADGAAVRDRLRDENAYLREELKVLTGPPMIVGHSPAFRRVLEQIRQAAASDSTVLLLGETGTGKGMLASRIHELSARRERAMVRVNCASLSAAWIESELFGGENGTFAATESRHVGRLHLANGSTVFLDEIADLPLEAQAILTRVLQDKQIHTPGGATPTTVDVRIVAATRKDLTRCMAEGTFRDDLFRQLNVSVIHLPPLRERTEDIPLFVWRFVDEFSDAYGKRIDAIDRESMAALQKHSWPGNARELRNIVERSMIVPTGRRLRIPLPTNERPVIRRLGTLADVEKEHITQILTACGGEIDGKAGAAARLGLTVRALKARMAKLGVRPKLSVRRPRD